LIPAGVRKVFRKAGAGLLLALLFWQSAALAETLTLSFIGDCSIGQAIQFESSENSYSRVLDREGLEWPFSLVYPILSADDFTFANLEVVFTEKTRHQDKRYPLTAKPDYAKALLYSGIDAVNTANNHAYDFYREGYLNSMQTLNDLGIPHFGSFNLGTAEAQDQLFVTTVKGVLIGALGFSYPQDSDMKKISNRIQTLREQGCDLVIVSMHWGRETHLIHESYQTKYAKAIIDAGADVVWGHHPHVLQPVQFYNGKPVFYSTGNFTFGTMSAVDPDTGIFQLQYEIGEDGLTLLSFTVVPCRTQGSGDYRPYILTDEQERGAMLKKLIYKKETKGFENLPASFADTGTVEFSGGAAGDQP
jgi:hypothetical protein